MPVVDANDDVERMPPTDQNRIPPSITKANDKKEHR
jgi:hypothetical protein